MKNPWTYYLLRKDRKTVGWKRVTIEYLLSDGKTWQFEPIPHDEGENVKLSDPPIGIATLKRPSMRVVFRH